MTREEWYRQYRAVRMTMRGCRFDRDVKNQAARAELWDVLFDVLYGTVRTKYPLAAEAHFSRDYGAVWWSMLCNLTLRPEAVEHHRVTKIT